MATTLGTTLPFLSLPALVRNKIYDLLLVHKKPIDMFDANGLARSRLPTNLLRVNKAVHRETSFILYSMNTFDCSYMTHLEFSGFIAQIGRVNASYITSLVIRFPLGGFKQDGTGWELDPISFRILDQIREQCTNLTTLTTSVVSVSAMEYILAETPEDFYRDAAMQMLSLVEAQFSAIVSARENVIIEVYEIGPSDELRRMMKRRGWTLRIESGDLSEDSEEEFLASLGGQLKFKVVYC